MVISYIVFQIILTRLSSYAVTPDSHLGNKSNYFHLYNENNQLKKQVQLSQRCFLDAQSWTWVAE